MGISYIKGRKAQTFVGARLTAKTKAASQQSWPARADQLHGHWSLRDLQCLHRPEPYTYIIKRSSQMAKEAKTNAMRMLERAKVNYTAHESTPTRKVRPLTALTSPA